ncbi:MAG: phosphatase PAP2 family protein, partial [Paludibacteraceae bacterium]|nr:phosphatase PAP2 family protein [Paludibacteraceae bacterium]
MKKTLWFYVLFMLFLLILGTLIFLYDKGSLHEMLTIDWISKSSANVVSFTDVFFKYITEVGGNVPFIVAAIFLFYRFGYAYFILLSQLAVTLVVQPIKHILNVPRPKVFFAENFPDVVLHQVEGVSMHSMLSFPSGHTASVFAFMLALSFICKRTWASVTFLLIAVLVGYSRIYLSQ